ncbi:hypothetical protein [Archaeoglobus neptunius]|uniref:hypothetical protein n=1 Tax=Archaeoglobus neptunius TaxID=2798580 RepID=UPI00192975EB|nr:hypothetical protein [Archaeoglobus neptunius]
MVLEIVRELVELEEQYPKVRQIEKMMQLEKQATLNRTPVATRVSEKDKQFYYNWRSELQNLYLLVKEALSYSSPNERAIIATHLKNTEIPELQALLLVTTIKHTSTMYNIKHKCQMCQVFHCGYPRRKVGEEAKKSKATPRLKYKNYERVIIEGHGIIHEPVLLPCERTVWLKIPDEEYGRELLLWANSVLRRTPNVDEAIAKIKRKINQPGIGYGEKRPFLIVYKDIKGLEGIAKVRLLIPIDPNAFCPRIKIQAQDETPQDEEPFVPEPTPDHFASDILYDPDSGDIFLSPKHGSEEIAV